VRRRGIGRRPCPGLDHARCRVRAGEHGRPGLPDPAPGQGHRASRLLGCTAWSSAGRRSATRSQSCAWQC
jgi:hypothetical protein